jgi:hypothetical protein
MTTSYEILLFHSSVFTPFEPFDAIYSKYQHHHKINHRKRSEKNLYHYFPALSILSPFLDDGDSERFQHVGHSSN